MGVGPDEVRRVAALARLDLTAEEVEALAGDLSRILDHVGALEAAAQRPTEDGPGAADLKRAAPDDDIPGCDPLARPPAEFGPAFEDGFFTVPRLASHADRDDGADSAAAHQDADQDGDQDMGLDTGPGAG